MTDKPHLLVKDLIAKLQDLDPEAPLFVRGYEDGVNYLTELAPVDAALFVNTEWYYGEHETGSYAESPERVDGYELVGDHVRTKD